MPPKPSLKRKRHKFSPTAINILKEWLYKHESHPFPTKNERERLCVMTGLDSKRVSKWFDNARARYLKKKGTRYYHDKEISFWSSPPTKKRVIQVPNPPAPVPMRHANPSSEIDKLLLLSEVSSHMMPLPAAKPLGGLAKGAVSSNTPIKYVDYDPTTIIPNPETIGAIRVLSTMGAPTATHDVKRELINMFDVTPTAMLAENSKSFSLSSAPQYDR